jgi:hypothetical protein
MKLIELLNQFQINQEADLQAINQAMLDKEKQESPLTVKIFATIGAWLSTLFFLFFLSSALSTPGGFLILGSLGIIFSLVLSKAVQDQPFIEALVVAANVCGQIMLTIGLNWGFLGGGNNFLPTYFIGLIINTLVFLLSQNSILQFGSILAIQAAGWGILNEIALREGIHFLIGALAVLFTLLWQNESLIISQSSFLSQRFLPLSFALAIGMSIFLLMTVFKEWNLLAASYWFISTLLIGGALLYFNYQEWEHYHLEKWLWIFLGILALILLPTLYSPGISASLLILSVSFQRGQKNLMAIGILFLILFITGFYYNLQISLLNKSGILFITGLLFLGAFWVLKKYVEEKSMPS